MGVVDVCIHLKQKPAEVRTVGIDGACKYTPICEQLKRRWFKMTSCNCKEKIEGLQKEVDTLKIARQRAELEAMPEYKITQKYNVAKNKVVHYLEQRYSAWNGFAYAPGYKTIFASCDEQDVQARFDVIKDTKLPIIGVA